MEVALDPAALVVGGREDARPGLLQLLVGRVDALGEALVLVPDEREAADRLQVCPLLVEPRVVDESCDRAGVGLDDGDRSVGAVLGQPRGPPVGGHPAVHVARPGVHELERRVHDHLGDRAAPLLGGVGGAETLCQQQERVGRVQPPAQEAGKEPERHERQAQRECVGQPRGAAVVDHPGSAEDDPGAERRCGRSRTAGRGGARAA